jgi:hypothetical protein
MPTSLTQFPSACCGHIFCFHQAKWIPCSVSRLLHMTLAFQSIISRGKISTVEFSIQHDCGHIFAIKWRKSICRRPNYRSTLAVSWSLAGLPVNLWISHERGLIFSRKVLKKWSVYSEKWIYRRDRNPHKTSALSFLDQSLDLRIECITITAFQLTCLQMAWVTLWCESERRNSPCIQQGIMMLCIMQIAHTFEGFEGFRS